jgi:hypothetical protein
MNLHRCIIHVKRGQQHYLCRMPIIISLELAVLDFVSTNFAFTLGQKLAEFEQHPSTSSTGR